MPNPLCRWPVVLACCLLACRAFANTEIAVGGLEMESEANVAGVPGDVADPLEEDVAADDSGKPRAFEPVIAPLPSRDPLLGWTLAVPVMLIYRPSFASDHERVWMTGAFGFYAENESWGAGVFHRMSLGGDAWRLSGGLFHADLIYDFYGIGGEGGNRSIEISQPMDLFMTEALRRVWPNFYLGLKWVYAHTRVGPRIPEAVLPPGLEPGDLQFQLTLSTLAPVVEYDTRDREFYPRSGVLAEASAALSRDAIGADREYENYSISGNHYLPLGEQGVLASRVAVEYVAGDAPFFLFPAFGKDSDLRGYQTGTYRDRFLLAAQAEYRHRFTARIGAVAFAGIGTVAPDFGEWGKSLPSAGIGLRWVVAPKNDVSLRVDVARGRDDTIWYVSVGEAF